MREQEKYDWMVYVSCMTFNQAPYIVDAMNGFTMQETNFPFVCAIVDDASTDGEQEVIRKYLKDNFDINNKEVARNEETDDFILLFAQHRVNKNCFFVVLFLKYNHYNKELWPRKYDYIEEWRGHAKYIAMCEGDDYWIDSLKLQKQYDCLEKNSQYSLCHCNYKILEDNILKERNVIIPQSQNIISIAKENRVATPTMFYRNTKEPLVDYTFPFKYPVYQHFLNMRLAEFGDIFYIDEPMAVYRKSSSGIYSKKSLRQKYDMFIGNIENMIDWYTLARPRKDVVEVVKKKARHKTWIFIKSAIINYSFSDILYFCIRYFRYL